ncbi:MAG: hypothetical protein KKI06_01300 [Euryarchaeota archaeon]|nr:hypothetical protein [Euryarchaeota archaeon]MBU4220604.1 hypothetical protein [Euryarchaeota archaeon]MCG2736421.1 hypothetical protein [Candidatus Methanoperedenaceae archaeon]
MQKQKFKEEMDTREIIEKRFEILACSRLRDKDRIKQAVSVQDRLRSRSKAWSGTEEIRKWRNQRK